ncbi:MAG: hypothetical protein ACR2M4_11385 [Actinomycetota bacterium]
MKGKSPFVGFVIGLTLLGACLGSGRKLPASERSASSEVRTGVPTSKDAPVNYNTLKEPSEPKELAIGPLAFIVDQGSRSVYEYDLGRRRFLGPAPRISGEKPKKQLPGYPTVVSTQPPQGATLLGNKLIVAGGSSGSIAIVPFDSRSGLGDPTYVEAPLVEVKTGARTGHAVAPNVGSPEGKPHLALVAPMGDHTVVAVSQDTGASAVGYLIDLDAKKVLKSAQLSDETAGGIASYGQKVLLNVSLNKEVLLVEQDLTVSRHFPLPGFPGSISVAGNVAVVGTYSPSSLVLLNLEDGTTRTVSRDSGNMTGRQPIVASKTDIWWALGPKGKQAGLFQSAPGPDRVRHLRSMDFSDPLGAVKESDANAPCKGIDSMVRFQKTLLLACQEGGRLGTLPMNGGVGFTTEGGFLPWDILLSPDR